MTEPSIEDIAAMREDGDLLPYLLSLAGRAPAKPKPTLTAVPAPAYRIAHTGGWPLGTAPTGPTPPADACTCPQHQQPATVMPTTHQEGAA
ncbi:hypothetical protein ACIQMV_08550 [Streptomyces sp. NPDC091412]|uniref:hypothetical protein n=1 Tax=Streptomyces sp. NPDC091412 TaxID=3366002 RepID=UPI003805F179